MINIQDFNGTIIGTGTTGDTTLIGDGNLGFTHILTDIGGIMGFILLTLVVAIVYKIDRKLNLKSELMDQEDLNLNQE